MSAATGEDAPGNRGGDALRVARYSLTIQDSELLTRPR